MSVLSLQRKILAHRCQGSRIARRARPRQGRSTLQQRKVVNVTAFKTQDETISISLDGYNLLQVGQIGSDSKSL